MRYCVIKDTARDVSNGVHDNERMYADALSAGFTAEQVEILTAEEYNARKALEPQPIAKTSEIDILKEQVATQQAIIDELLFDILPNLITDEEVV